MPKLSEMLNSRFLKKEDFTPKGFVVTFRDFQHMNVAPDSSPRELKWVAFFDEFEKGLVFNPTNAQTVTEILDSDDTDNWIGRQVVAFVDNSVQMAGKKTGGVRFRAFDNPLRPSQRTEQDEPRRAPPRAPRPPADEFEDTPY